MMRRNFVNLNINPCKMCMPLGAVTAFKGIEQSMVLLHGSQGCSTYIRRHMATHYNEPIDIGSSSLTEQGTVYGGAKNLKLGIKNIIKLYNPKIIGIATTCLAETIGEDVPRIISDFIEEEDMEDVKLIPVPTPGYGGTQFEGYFVALLQTVKMLATNTEKNDKINIIAPNMNPGDIRYLKELLNLYNVEYILLPDVSQTLDAPYSKEYKRIPNGGTKIEDIEAMAGAKATIEMGMTVNELHSPGKYLENTYGVPLYRTPIPMGLRNTDLLIKVLSEIKGITITNELKEKRGRLIDGMIDSHKYNGEGRAIIFGEPELVYGITSLCMENGIKPLLVATGGKSEKLKSSLRKSYPKLEKSCLLLDDIDFQTIQTYVKKLNANILIGNSDGKFVEEKEGIPLVRIGFPVHDRVGAQRKVNIGYEGTLRFLDDITNTILERKEKRYRKSMYDKYYHDEKKADDMMTEKINSKSNIKLLSSEEKSKTHPCYNKNAHEYARMHVPVAPKCNISCNYCSRKYDCPNESRPGVTSEVLSPEEALNKYIEVKKKISELKVLGIAGPGDALANFDETKRTIELIRNYDPEVTFCLSTNGLMLPYYANELIALGVSHVTITINAIDEKIGAKIYKHISYLGNTLKGEQAARILRDNQLNGLKYLSSKGVICKVNIVMLKGINDQHIPSVVKKVKECGAFMTNIMQMIPAPNSAFEHMSLVSNTELNDMRKKCEVDLKQMYHCRQCRADAIGRLDNDRSIDFRTKSCSTSQCASSCNTKSGKTYLFAVASKTGMYIDQHFGHAEQFYIYKYTEGNIEFVEKRVVNKYCNGVEDCDNHQDKFNNIIGTIKDCHAVLVLRAGHEPTKKLEQKNIKVFTMYNDITAGIKETIAQLDEQKEPVKCVAN